MNYTEDMIRFLEQYVPGHTRKEINEAFNSTFETDLPESTTTSLYKRMGLKTGYDGRFKKGRVSDRLGKKQSEYMTPEGIERSKKSRFKPGHIPANKRPVGSERINVDGYVEVKIKEPNVWVHKQRYVWQQAYGPIPEGGMLVFLDQNKQNCSLENLMLIDRRIMRQLTSADLLSSHPEITRTSVALAKLMMRISDAKGKKNG